MEPWTASYLLVPSVSKVVAPTLSPPEHNQGWFLFLTKNKIGQTLTQFPCNIGQRQIH